MQATWKFATTKSSASVRRTISAFGLGRTRCGTDGIRGPLTEPGPSRVGGQLANGISSKVLIWAFEIKKKSVPEVVDSSFLAADAIGHLLLNTETLPIPNTFLRPFGLGAICGLSSYPELVRNRWSYHVLCPAAWVECVMRGRSREAKRLNG